MLEKYKQPQPLVTGYADCWKAVDGALADARSGQQNPERAPDEDARQWQLIPDEGQRAA